MMAVPGIPFRCGREANDSTYCLHPDAVCNTKAIWHTKESFAIVLMDSFMTTQQPDRPIAPFRRGFCPAFFAITTAGCAWALALLLPDVICRLRSTLRRAVIAYCAAVALLWAHVASVFVQQGNFIPAIVFMMTFIDALLTFAYFIFRVVVDPICATIGQDWQKVRRKRFVAFFPVFGATLTIIQIMLMVYSDASTKQSRDAFNLIYLIQVAVSAACWPLFGLTISVQTRQLITTLEELAANKAYAGNGKSKHEAFLKQLRSLRSLARSMSLNCIYLIVAVVLIIVLGSVPYQFLFWAINTLGIWPAAYMVKRFVRRRQQSDKLSESSSIVAAGVQAKLPSIARSGDS